jgi:hypothetical protein
MSPRRNWDYPNPFLASDCAPPPRTGGRAHSPAGEGLGESQFRRLEKSLALCLLCGLDPLVQYLNHKSNAQNLRSTPGQAEPICAVILQKFDLWSSFYKTERHAGLEPP